LRLPCRLPSSAPDYSDPCSACPEVLPAPDSDACWKYVPAVGILRHTQFVPVEELSVPWRAVTRMQTGHVFVSVVPFTQKRPSACVRHLVRAKNSISGLLFQVLVLRRPPCILVFQRHSDLTP